MERAMMFDLFENQTTKGKFAAFDAENPQVYDALVRLAREWKSAGHAKLGIKTLIERLRWEWHVSNNKDQDGYKLNNNYAPHYARKIMSENDDLDGLFETRILSAE